MNPTQRGRALVAIGTAALLITAGPTWAAADGQTPGTGQGENSMAPPSIMLVLDASGSMAEADPSGGTKMEAARAALVGAVDSLPAEARVGLRVYGSKEDSATKNDTVCKDSTVVQPLGPVDAAALKSKIDGVSPYGWTPIAYSLGEAAKDLGEGENRHIILVSDGEETCSPDPCKEIQQLVDSGITIQIDTVGFGVNDIARNQLRCIAETSGGSYIDASDGDGLAVALDKLSTRTLRGFAVTGIPVKGVLRDNLDAAPQITSGQYTDTLNLGPTQTKYYALRAQHPGSRIDVSVTARPPLYQKKYIHTEGARITIETLDGDSCGFDSGSRIQSGGLYDFVVASVGVDRLRCENVEEFRVKIERFAGADTPVPIELLVAETPRPSNLESLPEGLIQTPAVPTDPPEPTAPAKPVIGGTGFSDALPLKPGTYVEQLIPGEVVFYTARVDWGQTASFVVDGPTDASMLGGSSEPIFIYQSVYNPARQAFVYPETLGRWDSVTTPKRFVSQVPEVRYRNHEASPVAVRAADRAGDYYVSLAISPGWQGLANGRPVPVEFTIDVTGAVAGVPDFASSSIAPTTTTGPTKSATSPTVEATVTAGASETPVSAQPSEVSAPAESTDQDRSWLWYLAGGAALILLLAGAVLWVTLRGSRHGGEI